MAERKVARRAIAAPTLDRPEDPTHPGRLNGAPVHDWVLPLAEGEQYLRDLDRECDFHLMALIYPASDGSIVETWNSLGMRGTGSHDLAVSNVFVPQQRAAIMRPFDDVGPAY